MTRSYTTRTCMQSLISKYQTVWPQFEYQIYRKCAGATFAANVQGQNVQGQNFNCL